jgi:hypothetical protein
MVPASLEVVLLLQPGSGRPHWKPGAALPWHHRRCSAGRPGPDDALLRPELGLPTPARYFAGAAQVVLLPRRAVRPDPPQGLGPQLAPEGCQRVSHPSFKKQSRVHLIHAPKKMLGTFGVRRSSKTGFNSIPAVQCVNRYPRTKVGIAVDRNNTKVDSEPKVRAEKLRCDSKEWNRLKDEKAIQTSIDYYRVIIKCKGHECNFVRAVSRVYK